MNAFAFNTCPRIICERGGVGALGSVCRELGMRRPLLVTDPGILKLGLLIGALQACEAEGLELMSHGAVQADPSQACVLGAAEAALAHRADGVIGFGGGSSMDVAKLVALLAHPDCAQSLEAMYGVDKARGPRLPLVLVPTTAGTGSEVTPIAIVTTGATTKMGVVSPVLLPDAALLDATLTLGLPPAVTAATGIDAMVHAIEAYTSRIRKNPVSDCLAREALGLLSSSIATAVREGSDVAAREHMLLGAMLAGQAFANAPVAAVHALAYPLGGRHHIPHGLSNSLVLPHVMRFNISHAAGLYAELAPLVFPDRAWAGSREAVANDLIDHLEGLISELQLPDRLRQVNIGAEALPLLAEEALQQQRLLVNNPREVSYVDALAIYQAAY